MSGAADNVVKGKCCWLQCFLFFADISAVIIVWDMNTYKCCQTLSGEHGKAVFCVALDGVNVISGSHDSTIKQVSVFFRCSQAKSLILTWIISGICEQENVCIPLWDIRTAYLVFNLMTGRWFAPPQKTIYLPFEQNSIHQVSCAGDHTIKIWDLHSKECLATLDEHRDAIRAIQYDESKIVRTLTSPPVSIP